MTLRRLIKIANRVLIYAAVLVAVILSLAPIVYLLITSFKVPELTFAVPPVWIFSPTLKNYRDIFADGAFTRYFMNSLVVALSTTFIALALGTFSAYGFARFRFRGAFWLRMSTLIPQMLPPITIIVPLYVLFNGLKLTDTRTALIISYLTFTIPLSIWMMIGFFEDVPGELEESAMIDGCTRLGAMVRISLPIVAPGLAATAILGFLYCFIGMSFPLSEHFNSPTSFGFEKANSMIASSTGLRSKPYLSINGNTNEVV